MTKFNLFFAIVMVSMAVQFTNAKQISREQAIEMALRFSGTNAGMRSVHSAEFNQMTIAYSVADDSRDLLYVVNRGDGAGYVVVAGDDVVSNPVLGYAAGKSFDYASAPENLRWWLSEYARLIGHAVENGCTVTSAKALDRDIEPLVKTNWNQDYPFNSKCPTIDGQPTYTGCVATAVAQLMYYHRYPERGIGTKTYTDIKGCGQTLSADFGSTTYRWDDMDLFYDGTNNDEANDAVATLLYHCGVAAGMKYGTDGSGVASADALMGLIDYFGYSKGTMYTNRDYHQFDDWIEMLYGELEDGRPVYYEGVTESGGAHAFILDGCRSDGYFHVNWGWGGYLDEYYSILTLNPGEEQGAGGSDGGYAYSQGAFIGLRPSDGESEYVLQIYCDGFSMLDANDNEITEDTATQGDAAHFRIYNVTNMCLVPFEGYFGITMEDVSTGNEVYTDYLYIKFGGDDYGHRYYYPEIDVTFALPIKLDDGVYRMYPIFTPDYETVEPTPMNVLASEPQYVYVTVKGNKITMGEDVPAGVENVPFSAEMIVYPNPVGQTLTVNVDSGIERLEVFSLAGLQVLYINCDGESVAQLDMSALPVGTYFVRIVNAAGEVAVKKVIKL